MTKAIPKSAVKQKTKTITQRKNPSEYGNATPKWAFSRVDKRMWTIHEDFANVILEKLIAYENMTWNQITGMTRQGKNSVGTMSHNIPRGLLIRKAQKRLEELQIYEDEIFSLSLDNRKRLWGILDSGVLRIIWYDSRHEICPSNKRHT